MVVEVKVFSLFKNSHFRTIIVARLLPCGVGHVGQRSNWAFRAQRESNRYTVDAVDVVDVADVGRQEGSLCCIQVT